MTTLIGNETTPNRSEVAKFSFRHVPTGILVSSSEMFRALQLLSLGTSRVHVRQSMETKYRMEFLTREGRPVVKIIPLPRPPERCDNGPR